MESPRRWFTTEEPVRMPKENKHILFTAYAVLFSRYCIATFLSPFFPQRCTELGISATMEGFIFAAYPVSSGFT